MKSIIFLTAIKKRNNLKFLYGVSEIMIDPYFIARESSGKKVIYGRVKNTNQIRKFEYDQISNIRVLNNVKFSPVIPIIPQVS